jgi:replicative DNA helicase
MIAQQAGVNVSTLIAGRSREYRQKWNEARKEVESWPCFVDDSPQTASSLWSWARRAKNKGSVCLAVDYVQYIRGDDARMNEEQRISQAIEACRRISIDLSLPVIAIASQNYAGTLRGSGQIEYAAVNWIKMEKWETEDKSSVLGAHVSIPKSRYSQQYSAFPLYHSKGMLLEEAPMTKQTVETVQNMEDEL